MSSPANELVRLVKAKNDILLNKNPGKEIAVELITSFGIMRVTKIDAITPNLLELGVFEDMSREKGEIIIADASQCMFRFSSIIAQEVDAAKEFVVTFFSEDPKPKTFNQG